MPGKRGRPPKKKVDDDQRRILTSQQEVIEELRMGRKQFCTLLRKYPFGFSGAPGKINGRWHVLADDVWAWFRYVQNEELRHPDNRRRFPAEPPALTEIKAR